MLVAGLTFFSNQWYPRAKMSPVTQERQLILQKWAPPSQAMCQAYSCEEQDPRAAGLPTPCFRKSDRRLTKFLSLSRVSCSPPSKRPLSLVACSAPHRMAVITTPMVTICRNPAVTAQTQVMMKLCFWGKLSRRHAVKAS
jgi:hypothetical protein